MSSRFETYISQELHDLVERDGGRKIWKKDGRLFYIQPGGEFDGERWRHAVLEAKDCAVQ